MVEWLKNPQNIEAHTSMPDLNITEKDAWDISSYLFRNAKN